MVVTSSVSGPAGPALTATPQPSGCRSDPQRNGFGRCGTPSPQSARRARRSRSWWRPPDRECCAPPAGSPTSITLGVSPRASADELAGAVRALREGAESRFDQVEVAQNQLVVGDQAPPWILRSSGSDLAGLKAAGSVAVLSGSTTEMAQVLRRRRDELGISYICTSLAFADALAPVVGLLAGS